MSSADLGPQLEAYVADLVAAGRYASKAEVLREGVRAMHEREARLAAPAAPPPGSRHTLAELLAASDYSQPPSAQEREWVNAPAAGREPL